MDGREKRNLGDVLHLGELESEAKATEEDGDERRGLAEGIQT